MCCALPLGFTGQRLPCPVGVGFRLRLTNVDRPIQGKGDIVKHRPIHPLIAGALPESWMGNASVRFPTPVIVARKHAIFVAACSYEVEILLIRYFVFIDGKRGNVDGVGFVFVVPSENTSATREAESNGASRNFYARMIERRSNKFGRLGLSNLSTER